MYDSADDISFENFIEALNGNLIFLFKKKPKKLNKKLTNKANEKLVELMFEVFPEYKNQILKLIDVIQYEAEAYLSEDPQKINNAETDKQKVIKELSDITKNKKKNIEKYKIITYIERTFNQLGTLNGKKTSAKYIFELYAQAVEYNRQQNRELKKRKT